jgi:hypothetical protein
MCVRLKYIVTELVFFGLADVVTTNTMHLGQIKSHKSIFWYEAEYEDR